ncbi:MAG: hypothetical protein K8W52_38855 [Deltaproteobacteria bacterium]|nr:hypothetical protein [Deltaproteobacteria bacterium]
MCSRTRLIAALSSILAFAACKSGSSPAVGSAAPVASGSAAGSASAPTGSGSAAGAEGSAAAGSGSSAAAGSGSSAVAGSGSAAPAGSGSAAAAGSGSAAAAGSGAAAADPAPAVAAQPAPTGHDFISEANVLFRAAACGEGDLPDKLDAAIIDKYCKQVRAVQESYAEHWLTMARPFFAEHVPANLPKTVVYPFAGGDLSTALTVYPDADEITTLSLEPAGDARSIDGLHGKALSTALDEQRRLLRFLYTVDFSNTMDLIDSMRAGKLPGQLIFSLSALRVHGFTPVSLHYFRIEPDGTLHYLTDEEVAATGDPNKVTAENRNYKFSNMELRFQKAGESRVRVYRHIRWNLDDEHLKGDDRVIKHLAAKGKVAGMTKAASFLLSWESFSTIRNYLLDHVVWMVSDATGIPPMFAAPAGFQQETYGTFDGPHLDAGRAATVSWRGLWNGQPKRDLAFRFGYPDVHKHRHLVITSCPGTCAAVPKGKGK